jgi:hypothetical protein
MEKLENEKQKKNSFPAYILLFLFYDYYYWKIYFSEHVPIIQICKFDFIKSVLPRDSRLTQRKVETDIHVILI